MTTHKDFPEGLTLKGVTAQPDWTVAEAVDAFSRAQENLIRSGEQRIAWLPETEDPQLRTFLFELERFGHKIQCPQDLDKALHMLRVGQTDLLISGIFVPYGKRLYQIGTTGCVEQMAELATTLGGRILISTACPDDAFKARLASAGAVFVPPHPQLKEFVPALVSVIMQAPGV